MNTFTMKNATNAAMSVHITISFVICFLLFSSGSVKPVIGGVGRSRCCQGGGDGVTEEVVVGRPGFGLGGGPHTHVWLYFSRGSAARTQLCVHRSYTMGRKARGDETKRHRPGHKAPEGTSDPCVVDHCIEDSRSGPP
jgi:hypothetical protein